MRHLRLCVIAVIAFLVTASSLHAETVRTISGYTITSWSGSDGVSLGPVRALVQDRSGYLWVGSDAGLFRFDGFHFLGGEAIGVKDLPRLPVRALLHAANGDIWIGLGEGGGVYRLIAGSTLVRAGEPPLHGTVNALAQDEAGAIWAGLDDALLKFDGQHWTSFGARDGLGSTRVFHLRAAGRHFYVGTAEGLFEAAEGRFARVAAAGADVVRGTTDGPDGTLWLTDPVRGFRTLNDDGRPRRIAGRSVFLLTDRHGRIWVTTIGQGLWRLGGNGPSSIERLTLQNGLLSDGVWTLLEDREGNLWVGTHEGLNRLTPYIASPLTDLGITSTIVRDAGNVMWAASNEGVIRIAAAPDASASARQLFPLAGVRTLHVAQRGVVWAATKHGVYVLRDGQFRRLATPPGVPLDRVTTMTSDGNGGIWLADAVQGLWRLRGTTLQPHPLPRHLQPLTIALLHGDQHGTVWIAFERGTLAAAHEDGLLVEYGAAQGLTHDAITGIYDDDSGLWVSGNQGLSHFVHDHFVTLGRAQGLPVKRALSVVGDGSGTLWLALDTAGIARLPIDEFERTVTTPGYTAHVRIFDTSDGTAGVPTRLDRRTSARSDDGRVWFVTGRGLTVVNPAHMRDQPLPSGPVRVEAAVVDDRRFASGGALSLPAGTNRLRIDYTALNLTTPDRVRFRYRLEGFDDDWRDAGSRRQAFYTNLPPGAYRFRVEADDGAGGADTTAADWAFAIEPHVYETRAFYALAALSALALVAAAWRLRLRKVRRDFLLVLNERTRLSREMHDGLLQTMVGVALKIDNAATHADATAQLRSVRRDIEDCIVEARQAIWNMRANDGGSGDNDLIVSLERAGARATAGTPVRFRLNISGAPRRCGRRIDNELLRIAQEALTNAIRHGQPSTVALDLHFAPDALTLRLTDNGRGFDESTHASTHHFGLVTMQERAEQLGGTFRVTTAAGTGTQIETVIPVPANA